MFLFALLLKRLEAVRRLMNSKQAGNLFFLLIIVTLASPRLALLIKISL